MPRPVFWTAATGTVSWTHGTTRCRSMTELFNFCNWIQALKRKVHNPNTFAFEGNCHADQKMTFKCIDRDDKAKKYGTVKEISISSILMLMNRMKIFQMNYCCQSRHYYYYWYRFSKFPYCKSKKTEPLKITPSLI